MDYFCPSYFSLLRDPEREDLTETDLNPEHRELLKRFSEKGIRCLLVKSALETPADKTKGSRKDNQDQNET